jgi:hypothetical protein
MSLKRLVPIVVGAAVLAGAAGASAATVAVSPGGAVTGTAGASQITGFGAQFVACSSTRYTATYNTGGTGVTLPYTISANLQLLFTGCRLSSSAAPITIACTATASLNVTSITSSGVTPGTITGIACTLTVTGSTCSVRLTGRANQSHSNGLAQLTILATGQTLVGTGSTDGRGGTCSVLPNSTALTLANGTGGSLVFTETPAQVIIVV